jgi:DMSO/TMAO reductase YedYZ heme-binding membrane subunit
VSPQFWWYVTRASGIVAWLMLTASVIWGVILSTKAFPEQRRPAWLLDLHRWLGGLTVSFVAIHLIALVADSYVHFTLIDLAVPFASDWKPGAVALGVIATWLLVAVEVTSLAMRRLPKRVWRAIHLSSYAVFWLASIHAALAGTDRAQRLYQVTAAASIIAVAWALMYRLANRRSTVIDVGHSGATATREKLPAAGDD